MKLYLVVQNFFVASLFFTSTLMAVNFQQTQRSNSLTFEKLEDSRTNNGHVINDYDWIFTAGGSYVDSPLVVKTENNSDQIDEVIPFMYGLHLGLGYYFKTWFMLGATATYNWFDDNQKRSFQGFSDPQVKAKIRLIDRERWAVSVIPFVNIASHQGTFTTGGLQSSSLNGMDISPISDLGLGWGGKISLEYLFDWAQIVGNIGYKNSDKAIDVDANGVTQVDYRETLMTGLGAYLPFGDSWGFNLEYIRRWGFPIFDNDQQQNEFFVGAAGAFTRNIHGFAGVGFGNLFTDNDGNDYRISAGFKIIGNLFAARRQGLKAIYLPNKSALNSVACRSPYVFGSVNNVTVRFDNNVGYVNASNDGLIQVASSIRNRISDIKSISVDGHTSAKGSDAYNQKLSQARASQVKSILKKEGIPSSKMSATGYGEKRLLNKSDTGGNTAASAENRRVEFKVELDPSNEYCN